MKSHPTPNAWIGRSIGDQRYRLEKRIGGGGMGDVFLAMDTRLGQQVALKLLKGALVESNEMRRRFEREVEVCAALQSEHIVKVTDCGVTEEGFPFYVMEYLRGETLRRLLRREKRLSLERAASIISQVCKGLQLAHKGITLWREGATVSEHIQVVHRDLKPDNIFLVPTDFGEIVKIVDFGIAKIRNESSEQTNFTAAFIGTFRYATPEQLTGDSDIDGRADIYSLGVILYEMLSGVDPFGFGFKTRNISETSWVYAHTTEPPRSLRSQPGCENIPSELEAVVMRCLQKEAENRFATVEELNQALQATVNPPYDSHSQILGSEDETLSWPLIPEEWNKTALPSPIPLRSEQNIDHIFETPTPIPIELEETYIPPRRKFLSLKAVITLAMLAIACIGSIYIYPLIIAQITLKEIQNLKTKAYYKECIAKSEMIPHDSSIYPEVQEILNQCRMEYTIKLAEKYECVEAGLIAHKIPENSPLYSKTRIKYDEICGL